MINIESVDILYYQVGSLDGSCDRVFHKKSLQMLSVVQAIEGSYDISIDDGPVYSTSQMGAFIAPSSAIQRITHNNSPLTNNMKAHWLFIDAVVNKKYKLDELYAFPVILPHGCNERIYNLIDGIKNENSLCIIMSYLYQIIDMLLQIGSQKEISSSKDIELRQYIEQNFDKSISIEDLAGILMLSVPSTYRFFKRHFNETPSGYINRVRLEHACFLLMNCDYTIRQTASLVGIYDPYYFSKIFKKKYGVSPAAFKEREKRVR